MSLRIWIELFAWGVIIALALFILAVPLPENQRPPVMAFLLLVACLSCHRFSSAVPADPIRPDFVYATLLLDVLIIGALSSFLRGYLPNLELALSRWWASPPF